MWPARERVVVWEYFRYGYGQGAVPQGGEEELRVGWDVRWTGDLLSRGGGDFYEVMMRWTWQVDDGYIGPFGAASSWTLGWFLLAGDGWAWVGCWNDLSVIRLGLDISIIQIYSNSPILV